VVVAESEPHADQQCAEAARRRDLRPVLRVERVRARREVLQTEREDERPMRHAGRDGFGRKEVSIRGLDPSLRDRDVGEAEEAIRVGEVVERDGGVHLEGGTERPEQGTREQPPALQIVGLERIRAVFELPVVAHPVVDAGDVIDGRTGPMRAVHVGPANVVGRGRTVRPPRLWAGPCFARPRCRARVGRRGRLREQHDGKAYEHGKDMPRGPRSHLLSPRLCRGVP
jgi:hypothetical protein